MMINEMLFRAERGEPLWLPDLRGSFANCVGARKAVVRLTGSEGSARDYELFFPPAEGEREKAFLLRFAAANVYNLLSAFSGREVRIFCDDELRALLAPLPALFDAPDGFGKVRNIARRIHGSFQIVFSPLTDYAPSAEEETKAAVDLDKRLLALCAAAEEKSCVGVDIGGSDIKLAAAVKGKLLYTQEYDWNPAADPRPDPRSTREDHAGGRTDGSRRHQFPGHRHRRSDRRR